MGTKRIEHDSSIMKNANIKEVRKMAKKTIEYSYGKKEK